MDHFVTTRPRPALCKCGRPVLRGLAEGWPARVDPVGLPRHQQIAATLHRIPLYWITWSGLWLLDAYRAREADRWPVAPEHHCGIVWPVAADDLDPGVDPDPDHPPF